LDRSLRMNISPGTRLEDLVERYPAARVVLSRYGLDAHEEADPPRESVARFAEDRGIPVERILEELSRVADISRQEPPPSSFLSLLDTHEWLDEHFLLHQEALLAGDLALALALLKKVDEGQREHIRVEEEILLPVYERAGPIPGGDPRFYVNEHRKMLAILDGFKEALPRLIEKSPGERGREIIELFDQGYWFKRLLEHHDNREENILYPTLDRVTTEEERGELLTECFPE
jgi:hemerythrin-like domain-containing protein